jgi:hypothetical protein
MRATALGCRYAARAYTAKGVQRVASGRHFALSDRADLYRSVIELARMEPVSPPHVAAMVSGRFEVPPTLYAIEKNMRHWARAGALAVASGGVGKGTLHYVARPKAMTRPIVMACLGKNAGPILAELDALDVEADRLFEARDRQQALEVAAEPEPEPEQWGWQREPVRPEPDYYFHGTFTPDGVVISYDEFFRVTALLKRISERQ